MTRSSPRPSTTAARILGPAGEKEGPYDWVPPNYWYDTTHFDTVRLDQDQRGRLVGIRQRAERRGHRADHRLAEPVHVPGRRGPPVAEPARQSVPRQLRGDRPPRLRVRHAVQLRYRAPAPGTVPGRSLASTSRRPRSRTTRTPARSSRHSSTTPTTPRRRPPGPSTGSSTRAGRACCGTCTAATATSRAATSARSRPTSACTRSTPSTPAPSPLDNLGGTAQAGLSVESRVYCFFVNFFLMISIQ